MNDDLDTLLRQYLDGDLSPEHEPNVLRRIADDDTARALLRLELRVRDEWNRIPDVPSGFADRTMAALEAAPAADPAASSPESSGPSLRTILQRLWSWMISPQTLQVRPSLVALAALLIGATVMLWPGSRTGSVPTTDLAASTPEPSAAPVADPAREVVWTRFMYADDDASSVAVAGDFRGWEPIPLSKKTVDGQTVWTGIVPVPKGEHQYMFVIDGSRWVTDPLAPVQRSDGFGNKNAVLQL